MKNGNSIFKNHSLSWSTILLYCCFLFLFFSCFSILSFSIRPPLNYLYYVFIFLFCVFSLFWVFLFNQIQIGPSTIALVVLNLAVFFSWLFNRSSSFGLRYPLFSAFFFCCYQLMKRKKNIGPIMTSVFMAFVCFACYYAFYYRTELVHLSLSTRLGDFFDNENTVGYSLLYGLCLSFCFSLKRGVHFCWLIASALFTGLILSTGSRSALLIAILTFLLYIPLVLDQRFKKYVWIFYLFIVIGLFACLAYVPALSSLKTRLINSLIELLGIGHADTSTEERLRLLGEGIYLFFAKPLTGWGYNFMRFYSSSHLFSHNNFVELCTDFGLFGFVGFEFLVIEPLCSILMLRKKHAQFSLIEESILLLIIPLFLIQFFYVNSQLKFEYLFLAFACSYIEKPIFSFSVFPNKNLPLIIKRGEIV